MFNYTKLFFLFSIFVQLFILLTYVVFNSNDVISFLQNKTNVLYDKINSEIIGGKSSSPWFDEYSKIHTNNLIGNKNDSRKIVIRIGLNNRGYGNNIYGLLSCLSLAVLTDSATIVAWNIVPQFFKPVLPHMFDWYYAKSVMNPNVPIHHLHYFLKLKFYGKNVYKLLSSPLPTSPYVQYHDHYYAYFFEICMKPKFYKKIEHYNLAKRETLNNALLALNSTTMGHTEKLDYLFQVGFEVAGNLLERLWVVNDETQNQIKNYTDTYFKHYYVIGLQIRTQYLDFSRHNNTKIEGDIDRFVKCALDIERNISTSEKFKRLYKGVKWFVTADQQHVVDLFKKYYPNKAVSGMHQVGHSSENHGYIRSAVLDFELLSLSNDIIFTGGSTFGFAASIKNKNLPYYIEGVRNMESCKITRLGSPPRTIRNYETYKKK